MTAFEFQTNYPEQFKVMLDDVKNPILFKKVVDYYEIEDPEQLELMLALEYRLMFLFD